MSEGIKIKCLYCGKEVSNYKYFCDIECEVKHTDDLNNRQ
jgi:hypothetical protein